MAGGFRRKSTEKNSKETLFKLYRVTIEDKDFFETIKEEIVIFNSELNLYELNEVSINETNESAVVGEWAGEAIEIVSNFVELFDTASIKGLINLYNLGKILVKSKEYVESKNKKFTTSPKAILAMELANNELVTDGSLTIIGPYSISDPNDKLLELVNIDISGLDRIFGTQIGFQNQSDDGITQTEWKIYNSMSKLILSWKIYN